MSNLRLSKNSHSSTRSAPPKNRRLVTLNINRRGQSIAAASMSATSAKNEFGRALETALRGQPVVITKHEDPKAVLLSIEDFEALSQAQSPKFKLDALTAEFDALLDRMQTRAAAEAMEDAFAASPEELGRAARRAARRRVGSH
jgi:antitoxin Phd